MCPHGPSDGVGLADGSGDGRGEASEAAGEDGCLWPLVNSR